MNPSSLPTQVLVVHVDPVMAAGLAQIMSGQWDVNVLAQGDPARVSADHVVVADYQSGMSLLRQHALAERRIPMPAPKVLVISQHESEWEVHAAIKAGALGYVLQGCPVEALVHGVRQIGRGSRYLCPAAGRLMAQGLIHEALTSRELDVLRAMARGASNKVIANELGIAIGTVKAHVKRIFDKLEARTRTRAILIAGERGIIGSPPSAASPAKSEKVVPIGAATHSSEGKWSSPGIALHSRS